MKTMDESSLNRIAVQVADLTLSLLQEELISQSASAPTPPTASPSAGNSEDPASPGRLASLIDHTLLKPEASYTQIAQLCSEASQYHFASVCVNTTHVRRCAEQLQGTGTAVCATIGFPLGGAVTEAKVSEARQALRDGAIELDMVINIGALKSGDRDLVRRDIASVARACQARQALLKVILEAALLTEDEKVTACQLAKEAGADFVKTSTGFGPGGATAEDVALLRRVVGPRMGVKAAGGIRTLADVRQMIAAGASRIGASASVKIMQEAEKP